MEKNKTNIQNYEKDKEMKWLSISVSILILALLLGCVFRSHELSVEIVSITPNKTHYSAGAQMKMDIVLNASKSLKNVTIDTEGIENRVGKIMLHKSKVVNLVSGINNITFFYALPGCPPCQKLDYGIYPINVTVLYEEKVIAKDSTNIELRSAT